MYKILFLLLYCFSSIVFAQNTSNGGNINTVGNRVFLTQTKKLVKFSEVKEGSPYYNGKTFLKVNIPGYSKNIQKLRYNAYSDEMEFEYNNEVYAIEKEQGMIVNFKDIDKKYLCLNYNIGYGDRFGYLLQLLYNPQKYSLFKREKIELLRGEKSLNGITKDRNDYYSKSKDLYIIQYKGGFLEVTKNKLLEAFSEWNEVKNYLKSNNINLKKEEDLIKLITYVNTL